MQKVQKVNIQGKKWSPGWAVTIILSVKEINTAWEIPQGVFYITQVYKYKPIH